MLSHKKVFETLRKKRLNVYEKERIEAELELRDYEAPLYDPQKKVIRKAMVRAIDRLIEKKEDERTEIRERQKLVRRRNRWLAGGTTRARSKERESAQEEPMDEGQTWGVRPRRLSTHQQKKKQTFTKNLTSGDLVKMLTQIPKKVEHAVVDIVRPIDDMNRVDESDDDQILLDDQELTDGSELEDDSSRDEEEISMIEDSDAPSTNLKVLSGSTGRVLQDQPTNPLLPRVYDSNSGMISDWSGNLILDEDL